MIYTSGVISDINKEETLEQLQDNKMAIVCEKIDLKPGETLLDIGCGWGTLAKFASVHFGAKTTGITLGRNQTAWGNNGLRKAGITEEQSRILCMDYRDIPVPEAKYDKITCLEMAEHVGIRHLTSFLRQVNDMMNDDGTFFIQVAGLRKTWQYEDLIWGLFMNKYVFPGADASTPLRDYVGALESAGFEIKGVDTIGVHYSATLWRWYRNWMGNKEKVVAKYGDKWFRVSLRLNHKECLLTKCFRPGSSSLPTQRSLLDKEEQLATRLPVSTTLTPPTVLKVSEASLPFLERSLLARWTSTIPSTSRRLKLEGVVKVMCVKGEANIHSSLL